jgi:hypothetical protein
MVAPLETHASGFLTAPSQAPKVFTFHGVPESRNLPFWDPMTSTELWCHTTFSAETHLTRVQPRELLCSGSGTFRRWDPMVEET